MATNRVVLLSEQVLKQESVVQDNADMKVITPTILDVQNMYVLPILGTSLYNDLLSQVDNNAVTDDYKELLDLYILPLMIWWCRYELPLNMNYKYFNKAVGTQNADNMNPASMDDLQMVMDRAKNKAEWYSERATKYLLSNYVKFPLYLNQPNANIDTIWANRTNFTSGMVLGDGLCCMGDYNFKGIPIAPSEIHKCWFC